MALRIKPIKDFQEYEQVLNELDEMEQKGMEDTRGFRDLKRFVKKFEKPYIDENENGSPKQEAKELKKEEKPD